MQRRNRRGRSKGFETSGSGIWLGRLLAAGAGAAAALAISGIARQFSTSDKTVHDVIKPAYGIRDPQFLRSIGNVLPPPIVGGNEVTTLINGDEIFPAMLHAIRSARRSITMETYIYWRGQIAYEFAEALAERTRAGVPCHLLLDWYGSQRFEERTRQLMIQSGVQVHHYHPPTFPFGNLNHRTHRKLLVVDGLTGFTGGVGIADCWSGHAQDPLHWRDTHYQLRGPVVLQLQSAFTDNWLKAKHDLLHDERYFPASESAGDVMCQTFQSSPEEGSSSMRLMYLLAITAAQKSIRIATGYFVPDQLAVRTLLEARRRGVEIEIIVPGKHIDVNGVRYASRNRWGQLLRAGVRIYEYRPTMYHCKAMIVDDVWTSIGSANFDNRSFRLNDEVNLNVYSDAFAREQIEWFEQDKQHCRQVTLNSWRSRPATEKALDGAADLFRSQL